MHGVSNVRQVRPLMNAAVRAKMSGLRGGEKSARSTHHGRGGGFKQSNQQNLVPQIRTDDTGEKNI